MNSDDLERTLEQFGVPLPKRRRMLKIMSRPCDQCLLTKGRIVPGERAAQILETCERDDSHFLCHKGTIAGLDIACRAHADRFPGRAIRLAAALGIKLEEVDPATMEGA